MSNLTRHQGTGAYRRWEPPDFDRAAVVLPPIVAKPAEVLRAPEPERPTVKLPTVEEVEQLMEEARKTGFDAGYEEGTARGRVEAMKLHTLLESLDQALQGLDDDIAGNLLDLAVELAQQLVRHELKNVPGTTVEVLREALQQMPQNHAMVHLHPDDAALVREYLGEQLAHVGHRLIEDEGITRGGCRIDASGSQLDATLETRWKRIMANLGRDDPLAASES